MAAQPREQRERQWEARRECERRGVAVRTRAVRGGVLLGCVGQRDGSKRSPGREQGGDAVSASRERGCARARCEAARAVQVCARREDPGGWRKSRPRGRTELWVHLVETT